jgi:O-antigen ligase
VSLVSAQSRVAWAAYAAGVLLGGAAVAHSAAPRRGRPFIVAALLVAGAAVGVLVFDAWAEVTGKVQAALFDVRPGSSMTRLRIYEATFRMYPEHPIAGWGTQTRIPGLDSIYSAGTHSSILGMLFRHGVVGLVLYIGLWASIWRRVAVGAAAPAGFPRARYFWVMITVALLTFNMREVIDEWWWDQVVCMTLWTVWGLAITAQRIARRHPPTATSASPPR